MTAPPPNDVAVLPSACPLDCPDHCSLDVTVEDGRVRKIDGSRRSEITAGFICGKVRGFDRRLYGPDRLLEPALRDGDKGSGAFRTVSWDQALDRVAERLRTIADRHGAETILPFAYGGSNGVLTQGTADERLFRRLGTARLLRTVCAVPTSLAHTGLYGRMPGIAYQDYVHARLIVVWGANPSVSGIHLVPFIREAQQRGAELVVIDPRRTPLAKRADLHLAIRPGTDLPLALAVIDWLFAGGRADQAFLSVHASGTEALRERAAAWPIARAAEICGVDPEAIEGFARRYAEASPAVIRCGWGQERNRNGGSATAAILALPAVAGKLGVRGGGFTMSSSAAFKLDAEAAVGAEPAAVPAVNMNRLGRHLLGRASPPVNALFVYNANPLATLPEQEAVRAGLEREDLFTVVFDQVMTDTARYADVVLPATTFLEHRDLHKGYGSLSLQDAAPVIAPVGAARSNHAVFTELLDRLGLSRPDDLRDIEAVADAALGDTPSDIRDQLAGGGVAAPPTGATPVMFVDHGPRTDDGKVHLFPAELDAETPDGLYAYRDDPATAAFPLALISPATRRTISSTLGEAFDDPAAIELHPDDAAARGIANGDPVRVWNQLGEVQVAARVSEDLRPGVVYVPKGLWAKHTVNGRTSNALVPATAADLGGGACFNDARVEVARR